MDYHVFIISRIREAFDRGMTTEDAVAHGIKSTAGVVTSAALVMVGVFSIFATLQFMFLKQFGVGLAVAVLIDATIVRAVLLPASMKLLGDWNWYLPRWLEWLPRLEHEHAGARAAADRRARIRAGRLSKQPKRAGAEGLSAAPLQLTREENLQCNPQLTLRPNAAQRSATRVVGAAIGAMALLLTVGGSSLHLSGSDHGPRRASRPTSTGSSRPAYPGAILYVRDGDKTTGSPPATATSHSKTPMRANDHFKIASLTKTYTATVVLAARRSERKLRLDDNVEQWLPELVPNGSQITSPAAQPHERPGRLRDRPALPEALPERQPRLLLVAASAVKLGVAHKPLFPPGRPRASRTRTRLRRCSV